MDNMIINDLIKQVPSLVVLVFLVIYFLKFLNSLKTLISELYLKMINVIEENTKILGSVIKAVEDCQDVQKDFRSRID